MEKYSVIDIGSNSIRLLNAIVKDNEIISANKFLKMTRLGLGVDKTNLLSEESMSKSVEALKAYNKMIKEFGGKFIGAYATSAVRDSNNKERFLDDVFNEVGMKINVISGEEEALLGYYGVIAGLKDPGKVLIVDIGGGSTEFILGDKDKIHSAVSLNMGAVRMTDRYISSELVLKEEKDELILFVDKLIEKEVQKIKEFSPDVIVGIGGTITTIAAIDLKMQEYDREKIHNYKMNFEKIKDINSDLELKNLEERKKVTGLQPKRADIIYAGGLILETIMKASNLSEISVSDFDNLEGALVQKNILIFL
ncbi:MAG: Ppx/GppA phosphatase family protein [Acidaminobacteraceae bacterium]